MKPLLVIAVIAFAACGGGPPHLGTRGMPTEQRRAPAVADGIVKSSGPEANQTLEDHTTGRVVGTALDSAGVGLAGVTIVLTGPAITSSLSAISDAEGAFVLTVPPGTATLTAYYGDATARGDLEIASGKRTTARVEFSR